MRLKDLGRKTGEALAVAAANRVLTTETDIAESDVRALKQAIIESAAAAVRNHESVKQAVNASIARAVAQHQVEIDAMVADVVVDELLSDLQGRVLAETRRLAMVAIDRIGQEMAKMLQQLKTEIAKKS